MDSIEDVRRSLARYISEILPDYNVYISSNDQEFERPAIVVRTPDSPNITGAWHTQELTQLFSISAYPGDQPNPRVARREADRVNETLLTIFSMGDGTPGRYAWRIPIWDWEGVDLGQEGKPEIVRYIAVARNGVNGAAQPDSVDPRRWSVSMTLRLVWVRHAPVTSSPPVRSVNIRTRTVS